MTTVSVSDQRQTVETLQESTTVTPQTVQTTVEVQGGPTVQVTETRLVVQVQEQRTVVEVPAPIEVVTAGTQGPQGIQGVQGDKGDTGGVGALVTEEPSGLINGINDTFFLSAECENDVLLLSLNGVEQKRGSDKDYTLTSQTIVLSVPPVSGDTLSATYMQA